MARRLWLLLVISALFHRSSAARVSYYDGGKFINAGPHQLTADGVSGILGGLLNAETAAHYKDGVSEQVQHRLLNLDFLRAGSS